MKQGMTLTSLLLAVALSGIIAVFGGRLIVNQMFMAATAELIDKGNSIMQFYLNAIRDSEVWRCTMFDTANTGFKAYILGGSTSYSPSNGVNLRGPDCQWHDPRSHPTLTSSNRGYDLLPKNAYKYIGDSISGADVGATNGWWRLKLEVKSAGGRGDVDLILNLCLQETVYTNKHEGQAQVPKAYKHKCVTNDSTSLKRRVRYSENAIKNDCSQKAIISVTDRRGPGVIGVSCDPHSTLLQFNISSVADHKLSPQGLNRQADRQGIKPITCTNRHPIDGTTTTGDLTCSSNRALVESLTMLPDASAGSALCGKDNGGTGMDKVLCGFTNMGKAICCTPKGPKGPKGLKGCPALIVTGSPHKVNKSGRVCEPAIANTVACPTHTGYMRSDRTGC